MFCLQAASVWKSLKFVIWERVNPFPNQLVLDTFKFTVFADDKFNIGTNDIMVSANKTSWEKETMLSTSIFSFSLNVFQSLLYQGRKNRGLFGKGFYERIVKETVSLQPLPYTQILCLIMELKLACVICELHIPRCLEFQRLQI